MKHRTSLGIVALILATWGALNVYANGKYQRALDDGKRLVCGYGKSYIVSNDTPVEIDIYQGIIEFPLHNEKKRLSECLILTGKDTSK